MSTFDKIKAYHAAMLDEANRKVGMVSSSSVNQPPLDDAWSSPSEIEPHAYDGPAPRGAGRPRVPQSQQQVWDRIARRHPRKFKQAVRYLGWLDRMEIRYSQRIL